MSTPTAIPTAIPDATPVTMPDAADAAPLRIQPIARREADAVLDVLCEAFAAYPVMRHTLGEPRPEPRRLRTLIHLFASGRWLRGHPILGARDVAGRLLGVAALTPPGDLPPPPAELAALAESTWGVLGADSRQRYDELRRAWDRTSTRGAWWHLNMLGVRPSHAGRGIGERLLRAVCELAAADAGAEGVDLTTEDAANLDFYRRRGFTVFARADVADGLQTWTLASRT